jgi:hypothetical protein
VLTIRFLLLFDICGCLDAGRSLWREERSVVYNCCWSSPAQSFSGPSPVGLATIFYSLRFETPPTWRVRSPYLYPQGTAWPSYTPRHWVPFSCLLWLTGLRWRYSNPPPSWRQLNHLWFSLYSLGTDHIETALPRNGRLFSLHCSGFQASCHSVLMLCLLSRKVGVTNQY